MTADPASETPPDPLGPAEGTRASTASEQLALLRAGGLPTAIREGRVVRYRADRAAIARQLGELQGFLQRCCPPASTGRDAGRAP